MPCAPKRTGRLWRLANVALCLGAASAPNGALTGYIGLLTACKLQVGRACGKRSATVELQVEWRGLAGCLALATYRVGAVGLLALFTVGGS